MGAEWGLIELFLPYLTQVAKLDGISFCLSTGRLPVSLFGAVHPTREWLWQWLDIPHVTLPMTWWCW